MSADTTGREAQAEKEPLAPHLRVRRALGRVRRSFVREVFDVFVRPVPQGAEFEPLAGYSFTWATPADIAACEPHHTELDAEERRLGAARLELGHRAVVARVSGGPEEDPIVFSMWVNPRNLNVPGVVKRRLAGSQWFIYKAFTSPDHRGRKLYEAGMRFVLAEMGRQGLTQLVGYAHVKKRISRKGLAALSFESAGRMVELGFLRWRHTFVSAKLARAFPEETPRSRVLSAA